MKITLEFDTEKLKHSELSELLKLIEEPNNYLHSVYCKRLYNDGKFICTSCEGYLPDKLSCTCKQETDNNFNVSMSNTFTTKDNTKIIEDLSLMAAMQSI